MEIVEIQGPLELLAIREQRLSKGLDQRELRFANLAATGGVSKLDAAQICGYKRTPRSPRINELLNVKRKILMLKTETGPEWVRQEMKALYEDARAAGQYAAAASVLKAIDTGNGGIIDLPGLAHVAPLDRQEEILRAASNGEINLDNATQLAKLAEYSTKARELKLVRQLLDRIKSGEDSKSVATDLLGRLRNALPDFT